MALIMLSNFIQVLSSIRNHPTKNKHFPMHNIFIQFIYSRTEIKS
jgi:hypothetical protein